MEDFIFWGITILIIGLGVWLAWYYSGPRTGHLPRDRARYYREHIRRVSTGSPTERIVQYDKILSHILRDYGYEGTVSDQLRANPSIIPDMREVWRLHKLRNRLVHDMNETALSTLKEEANTFQKLLLRIL